MIVDRLGHYVYIIEKDGTLWSLTYEPCRTNLEGWKCSHGLGYTTYEASYKGAASKLKIFIHPDYNVLVWDLEIENKRGAEVELFIAPYVEFSFQDVSEEVNLFHLCRMQNSLPMIKN